MKEEKRPSQWREILSAGVDGWSSFSDTCSDEPNEKDQGNTITTSKSVLEQIKSSNNKRIIIIIIIKKRNRTRRWMCTGSKREETSSGSVYGSSYV